MEECTCSSTFICPPCGGSGVIEVDLKCFCCDPKRLREICSLCNGGGRIERVNRKNKDKVLSLREIKHLLSEEEGV